jgi:hypothetical protein
VYLDDVIRGVEGLVTQIHGRIEHTALSKAPSYSALSYVWGPPDPYSRVVLGDGSYLPITRNLLEAFLLLLDNDIGVSMIPLRYQPNISLMSLDQR